jgi:hypothetical protein
MPTECPAIDTSAKPHAGSTVGLARYRPLSAISRKPSCLISWIQPGPLGGRAAPGRAGGEEELAGVTNRGGAGACGQSAVARLPTDRMTTQ